MATRAKAPQRLLERDAEQQRLVQAIAAAGGGSGRVVVVRGDAGNGKSALLAAAAQRAASDGLLVLGARGGELEQTTGFGVARQLLEATLQRAPAAERAELLEGAAELAGPLLGVSSSGALPVIEPSQRRHGLYWLLANLADRRPTALLVDDAQWSDEPSLDWLLYLARRLERLPVLLVVAVGGGEPGAAGPLLEAIAAEPLAESLTLGPLSAAGTAELLAELYDQPVDSRFAAACHEWTGGNPHFASELAAELVAEQLAPVAATAGRVRSFAADRVSSVTLLRLRRLPRDAVALARALAILGTDGKLRHAAELARLDEAAAVAAADALVDAGFVRRDPALQFAQPLLGRVIYDDLPPTRRAADHKRAARLLEADGASAAQIATQLLRSDPDHDPWVAQLLGRAAAEQLGAGAGASAAPLLRRALAEPPAPDDVPGLLLTLGLSECIAGLPNGLATMHRALGAAPGPVARAHVGLLLGRFLVIADRGHEAVATLEPLIAALDQDEHELRLQLTVALVTAARAERELGGVANAHLAHVRSAATDDSPTGRVTAVQCAYASAATGAPAAEAIAFARTAIHGGTLLAEAPMSPDVYLVPISMLAICDELEEADDHYAAALAQARRSGSALAYAATASLYSWTKQLRGELAEGELLARDALRLAEESPALAALSGFARGHLALALVEQGDGDGALELAGPSPLGLADAAPTWSRELLFAAGRAELLARRPAQAVELLLATGRASESFGITNPAFLPWRSYAALALHELGETTRAAELGAEELSRARRFGAARPFGIALRARGLVLAGADGLALLEESVRVLAESPARLEYARALVSLGAALRRGGRRAHAREPLAAGLELAERCGAAPLVEEALTELSASGARRRAQGRWGADALTPSELRVCRMAADGMSNPSIAQALFVTRGTVESQLHAAYRKLGISSRTALPSALESYSADA